jgi:hypothetical protein
MTQKNKILHKTRCLPTWEYGRQLSDRCRQHIGQEPYRACERSVYVPSSRATDSRLLTVHACETSVYSETTRCYIPEEYHVRKTYSYP